MSTVAKYTVHQARPLALAVAILVLCLLSVTFGWHAKSASHENVESSTLDEKKAENSRLQEQIDAMGDAYRLLQEENVFMREERELIEGQLVQLDQSSDIDRQAIVDVRKEMAQLQDQLFDLRRELEFYRGIMNTTQNATGLQIQGWYTRPTGTDNQYRYKIVLTNLSNKDKDADGILRGNIYGKDADGKKEKSLSLKAVLLSDTEFSFKFRNFKVFEGHVQLPDNFEPLRVQIVLTNKSGKKTLTKGEFNWIGNKN
ncbi:MAG: DUF6776 family protein [Candidatus Porifericomitaceae bacterium WSBS_2022_MAG_OTU9]